MSLNFTQIDPVVESKNFVLDAGIIIRNPVIGAGGEITGAVIGLLSGGTQINHTQTFRDIQADGIYVPTKGLVAKSGETFTASCNIKNFTKENIRLVLNGTISGSSEIEGYDQIETKNSIADADYEDYLIVGRLGTDTEGFTDRTIIIWAKNCLASNSGEMSFVDSAEAVIPTTITAYASKSNTKKLDIKYFTPIKSI